MRPSGLQRYGLEAVGLVERQARSCERPGGDSGPLSRPEACRLRGSLVRPPYGNVASDQGFRGVEGANTRMRPFRSVPRNLHTPVSDRVRHTLLSDVQVSLPKLSAWLNDT